MTELSDVLADADGYQTEGEQYGDPSKAGDHAQVNFWFIHAPPAGENVAQRLNGVRLRQKIRNVPQVDGHALQGPHDTTQQQSRVEASQRKVGGRRFFAANARQQESWAKIHDIFQNETSGFFFIANPTENQP